MTRTGAPADSIVRTNALHRSATKSSGTLLLWTGSLLTFAGLVAVISAWTILKQPHWVSLAVVLGCLSIVSGANFAWWGDRFRHYDPLFPSGPWGAVFATGCLVVASVTAVAVLIYFNYSLLSVLVWFQSE